MIEAVRGLPQSVDGVDLLLKKLSCMLAVLNVFQKKAEQLVMLFSWIHHIAHLLNAETNCEQAQSQLLTFVINLRQNCPCDDLLNMVAYIKKITMAFTPHLFDDLKQPLLPRTNNDLKLFIGRIKKSRRHITGRKNPQDFILREGSFVAMLFGLPHAHHWGDAFSSVNLNDFRPTLTLLRQTDQRSRCWHVRRDLMAYLMTLEQPWMPHE